MIAKIKYGIIWFLDWVVDVHIFRHRFHSYCEWVARHPWWGEENAKFWADDQKLK